MTKSSRFASLEQVGTRLFSGFVYPIKKGGEKGHQSLGDLAGVTGFPQVKSCIFLMASIETARDLFPRPPTPTSTGASSHILTRLRPPTVELCAGRNGKTSRTPHKSPQTNVSLWTGTGLSTWPVLQPINPTHAARCHVLRAGEPSERWLPHDLRRSGARVCFLLRAFGRQEAKESICKCYLKSSARESLPRACCKIYDSSKTRNKNWMPKSRIFTVSLFSPQTSSQKQ